MTVRAVTTARHLFDVGGVGHAPHCGFSLEDREALPEARQAHLLGQSLTPHPPFAADTELSASPVTVTNSG